jgi:amino acid adenylation domain-containing protein
MPDSSLTPHTFIETFRQRAFERPAHRAFGFLPHGEGDEHDLTYGELEHRARAVGGWLQAHRLAGERVLLLYPPGLEYISAFLGCLFAGAVAVPAHPPRLHHGQERLRAIAADAQPSAALTTLRLLAGIDRAAVGSAARGPIQWLATDELPAGAAAEWRQRPGRPHDVVMLQYTSGSTAIPKGVMVTNANLLHNQELMKLAFASDETTVVVGWLPLYHDMGLIGNVLHTLFLGASAVLMPPVAFLQRPLRWLEAISRYRATISGGPDFAYELCVRRTAPEERQRLDLTCWRSAFNGSEPVRAETLDRFSRAFEPHGFRREAFYPCYGLAEATLIVAGGRARRPSRVEAFSHPRAESAAGAEERAAMPLVSCGVALDEGSVKIVDPDALVERAQGEVGEIWIRSPSVARGYWGRAAETAQAFTARLVAAPGAGTFLRTGDLGTLRSGELFICGRLKDLIIVRGVNHYAEDLEWTAQGSHPALRPASTAAFAVDADGAERVVIVAELEPHRDAAATAALKAICRSVAVTHEIEVLAVVLVRRGGVPKTSSGKVQRGACRRLYLERTLPVVVEWEAAKATWPELSSSLRAVPGAGSREEIEAWLTKHTTGLGGASRQASSRLALTLAQCGLDSLAVVELGHRVELTFGVRIPAETLLGTGTLAELAAYVVERAASADAPVNATAPMPTGQGEPAGMVWPLSCGQEALWVACQLAPRSAYNIAAAVRLLTPVPAAVMREAWEVLIQRHPLLRARFLRRGGFVAQEIQERIDGWFHQHAVAGLGAEVLKSKLAQEASRPFDLERGPLFRVVWLAGGGGDTALLLVVHHTIADFWSLGILVNELGRVREQIALGRPPELPPCGAEYASYVAWQRSLVDGAEGRAQLAYWREQLAGYRVAAELPADRPRPPSQTYRGASESLRIEPDVTARLQGIAGEHGASLFAVLLTAFQILLSRFTGQDEVVVGSPAAARQRPEWRGVVGYFANPLVLRGALSGDPSFAAALAGTRQMLAGAMAHQDYPLGRLQDELLAGRQGESAGLFRVMFLFYGALLGDGGFGALALNVDGVRGNLGGLQVESLAIPREVAPYDLTFGLAVAGRELVLAVKYSTDLFERGTIRRLAGHYGTLLRGIAYGAARRVGELPLLTDLERLRLLAEWNDTAEAYGTAGCVHELFEQQVERTPDATAVTFEGRCLSYGELERRANQLARRLRALGVAPEVLVAVCLQRSLELVVGLLAVVKAGGAYVPLDPEYPRERLRFILEDSGAWVILTQDSLLGELPAAALPVVCLDRDWAVIALAEPSRLEERAGTDQLLYVIYTSGSTGRPKGVANTRRGVANLLAWMQRRFGLTPADAVAQKTAYGFDVSVWEVFWPLAVGARMVVATPGGQRDRRYLIGWLAAEGITLCHFVPPVLQFVLDGGELETCRALRHVLCGGEPLTRGLAERFRLARPDTQLHNMYGPTEASVDATSWTCPGGWQRESLPIGRPIGNLQAYVLDRSLTPVPIGAVGELYLGGEGLARGYLSRPALTAERFLPHPYAEPAGARLYRTGDLAKLLPDGNLVFLGRSDDQIKLQGHRIEPGETAAVLSAHPRVSGAYAVVAAAAGGDRQLVAYVGRRDGHPLGADELKEFLAARLPAYLVPSLIVILEALPLGPNGKVSREALPPPCAVADSRSSFVAPRTPLERLLAGLWAEGLNLERVGVDDDFFELGGHSLLAAEISARLQERLGTDAPLLSLFFQNPTVSGMAEGLLAGGLTEDQLAELVHG